MATLQNIRSKGPLLIIVIGLALFAFIAGDAWKVVQPHQSQDVGEVNGKAISAQEYQAVLEEYTEVIKFSNGLTSLTDEQTNQLKDEVWRRLVENRLIEAEAEKLGLTVTKQEIQAVINAGVHPMLQSTPFQNPQTGRFDQDMLKMFLAEYAKMDPTQIPDYYRMMAKFWSFVEKSLVQSRLAEKYQSLVMGSVASNPVEARMAFDGRVNQMDLLLAAVPYTSVPDSTISVKNSEIKELYNKRKEQYRQYAETRDIKYIDVQITASEEDRAALQNEVMEYAGQLEGMTSDYTAFIRSTGSEYPYVDLYYSKEAYPSDIVARLDSVAIGEVYGPYTNAADNTLNVFKKLARTTAADSIQFRQIQVYEQDITRTREVADSIYTALRNGADFEDLASRYGQPGTSNWITSANYENSPLDSDNLKYISSITSLGVNEMANVQIGVANVILQVTSKRAMKDKYKVAVVKRKINFSNETYNKAYNDFSQFVAANSSLEDIEKNAEDAGYRLLERSELNSSEHVIGGVRGSKEALRWAFTAKPGDVSGLFEAGDNDRLLVVGLSKINKEGYRPIEQVQYQLRAEVVKDKKAEKIMADMKNVNASSLDSYKAMPEAVSDTIKMVTFAAPAYISVLRSSEPLVGAYASVAPMNQVSTPIKGTAGVMVMQVYNKEQTNDEYVEDTEKANLENMHQRMLGRFITDLYQKANVKDTRYLFF
ncbi:MAG: SurA N-terminal domain-containing protein [Bacteroides sp.]|nr:SurA N-terminal domain-containing protein [Bacteroides sp.]